MRGLFRFPADESGAVVLDWAVLVAGVLLNGTMVVLAIFNGDISPLAQEVNAAVASADPMPAPGTMIVADGADIQAAILAP
jgi:hypothetical protein